MTHICSQYEKQQPCGNQVTEHATKDVTRHATKHVPKHVHTSASMCRPPGRQASHLQGRPESDLSLRAGLRQPARHGVQLACKHVCWSARMRMSMRVCTRLRPPLATSPAQSLCAPAPTGWARRGRMRRTYDQLGPQSRVSHGNVCGSQIRHVCELPGHLRDQG